MQTARIERGAAQRRYYFKWFGDYEPLREGLRQAGVPSEANWFQLIRPGTPGLDIDGATTIDAERARALHDRGVPFIDVSINWIVRRIPRAHYLNMFYYEFNDALLAEIVDKTQEVVIYSSRDDDLRWSPQAVARAVTWGYEEIYYFRAGAQGVESCWLFGRDRRSTIELSN